MTRRCKRCGTRHQLDAMRVREVARDLRNGLEPKPEHVQRTSDLAEAAFRAGWLRHAAMQAAFELEGHCPTCALILASETGERERQERRALA